VSAESLPEALRRFLADRIDSVEQLEILLLLARDPDIEWMPADVARALYTHPDSAGRRLAVLHLQGLLARSEAGAYRYAASGTDAGELVEQLAVAYRERRVSVIGLIASRPMDNVRAFSDAFRLKREDE
jgi:hypothetical protein